MNNLIFKKEDGNIIINEDFFNRIFIKPLKENNNLSGIALKLSAVLMQILDDKNSTYSPSRTEMAKMIGCSRTAIINALVQLEKEGFIIRDSASKIEKDKKSFSDRFFLNINFNADSDFKFNNQLNIISGIENNEYVKSLEQRISNIEKILNL